MVKSMLFMCHNLTCHAFPVYFGSTGICLVSLRALDVSTVLRCVSAVNRNAVCVTSRNVPKYRIYGNGLVNLI
jgi:hypothetical protein